MADKLARARLLINTRRHHEAELELRRVLAAAPNDAPAHALLALALYMQDRDAEAVSEARTAVRLQPDSARHHHVLAMALLADNRPDDALRAIQEAIRLSPQDASHRALLARLYMRRGDWKRALHEAEAGLQFEPEHITCVNVRAMALVKLGRPVEADAALQAALNKDPENAVSHANMGWALLHQNEHEQAFTHFREALRLDPASTWAREGIVEALKARNFIYRLLLRYFLWMSRLTSEEQWGVIGGLYALRVGISAIASAFPLLWIVALPLILLYKIFVVLTWTARPLFSLLLRFDRFGRLTLPKEDIVASNWLAACLLAAELGVLGSLVFRHLAFLVITLGALAMIVPVAGIFHCKPNWGRVVLILYNALLVFLILLGFSFALTGHVIGIGVAALVALGFGFLWTLYSWVATIVIAISR